MVIKSNDQLAHITVQIIIIVMLYSNIIMLTTSALRDNSVY